MMSSHPVKYQQPSTNDSGTKAKSLLQETYDDAVKFLYGYEGFAENVPPIEIGKAILLERKPQAKIDEMTPLQVAEVERCMRTDRRWRFLGDEESLREIIREDLKTLDALSVTPEQIADRLESLTGQVCTRWREEKMKSGEDVLEIARKGVLIENKYFIKSVQDPTTLQQPCCFELANIPQGLREPDVDFNSIKRYGDFKYNISKGTLGGKASFPEVMIHLIRDHNFFGGKKSSFRLEPKQIVQLLDLEPGKDYKPKTKQVTLWQAGGYSSSLPEKPPLIVESGEKIELGQGVMAYIQGNQGIILSEKHAKFVSPPKIGGVEVELDKNEVQPGQTHIQKTNIHLIIG
jgi:hypothetical protein